VKILYVEDNSSFRELVNVVLRIQLHHDVAFAYDGRMAAEMIKEDPNYDLIITDVGMPNMDGNRFIEEIARIHAPIPIAVLTADPASLKTSLPNVMGVFDKMNIVNMKKMFEDIVCQTKTLP
jgi:CheY-like chemotaxis protein